MVAWCQRTHRGRGVVKKLNLERCLRVAETYYKGVRVGGGRAYERAQLPAFKSYVATMQREAQEWRAAWDRARGTDCASYRANYTRVAAEFSGFAASVSRIVPPSEPKGAQQKLRQALTATSEFWSLWSTGKCAEYPIGILPPDALASKWDQVEALMREWANAVVAAARAKGLSVDPASLVCCLRRS